MLLKHLLLDRIKKDKSRIEAWLVEHGAQVLVPTNEWEIIRYQAGKSTGVVYGNKRGLLATCVGGAGEMLAAFYMNKAWTAGVGTARIRSKAISKFVLVLLERDGDLCFYCGHPLGDDITREHLVALTAGGPNHISNMVLSHKQCNHDAGALSAMDKIRIREKQLYGAISSGNHHPTPRQQTGTEGDQAVREPRSEEDQPDDTCPF
jgi:hypothetical protein